MEDKCEHKWEELERRKVLTNFRNPGWFVDGWAEYGTKILQKCKGCGKYNTVVF